VRLQAKLPDDGVVVAVYVSVNTVHALEYLTDQGGERLGERYAYSWSVSVDTVLNATGRTNATRENRLVVNIALDPSHQLLDVCRRRHLGRSFEVLGILPQILEPDPIST
jgi:hypothetical protein